MIAGCCRDLTLIFRLIKSMLQKLPAHRNSIMRILVLCIGKAGRSGFWSLTIRIRKRKSVRAVLFLSHFPSPCVLSIFVERANMQKLHAEYVYKYASRWTRKIASYRPMTIHTTRGHLLLAIFLTKIEIYQVSESQERESSKCVSIKCFADPKHCLFDWGFCMAINNRKVKCIYWIGHKGTIQF